MREKKTINVSTIISKMEQFYEKRHTYVPLNSDLISFSQDEINIINRFPTLFYKCSANRVILVEWILKQIGKYFIDNDLTTIVIRCLYVFMCKKFKVKSFNLCKLQDLLENDYMITFQDFKALKNKIKKEKQEIIENSEQADSLVKDIMDEYNRKRIVNNVFGENVCSLNGCSPTGKLENLTPSEIEAQNLISQAKEDLGKDLCIEFLNNPEATSDFSEVLSLIRNSMIFYQRYESALNNIHPSMQSAKIAPLFRIFQNNILPKDIEILPDPLQTFEKNSVVFVCDLKIMNSSPISKDLRGPLLDFLQWISDDKIAQLQNEFRKLINNERLEKILRLRANGATLDISGREYGITRERVRQIEAKLLRKFNNLMVKILPHYILLSYSKHNYFLTAEDIKQKVEEFPDIFIYCLKNTRSERIKWSNELKGFAVAETQWLEELSDYVETMIPGRFDDEELSQQISNIYELLDIDIDRNIIRQMILSRFDLTGSIYTRNKMTKSDIYLAILEKYYPDGIKLYDDGEMKRFRNLAGVMFGEVQLPENNRAIEARIADSTVLCGRGKYILPKFINFDENLLNKIYRFIKFSERNTIMFTELYERFRDELLARTQIDSRYFLQGVLRYKYENDFTFTKDAIVKDTNEKKDTKALICDYIKGKSVLVTKNEIMEAFPGVSDAVLSMIITNTPEILIWGFGKYIHIDQLMFENNEIERFRKLLDSCIAQGSVSSRQIFNEIYLQESDFLIRNNVEGHNALYSLLYYWFRDNYEFNRPFIAPKGSTVTNFKAVIRDYISGFEKLYICDFKDFIESIRTSNCTVSSLIDEISDEFLRIDDDLLYRRDKLNLSDDIIQNIEETTLTIMGEKGYISAKKPFDFIFYPDVGVKWTPFLIVSIIKSCGKHLKIIDTVKDYRYLNEIIINSSLPIDEYDELLKYALKREANYSKFKNPDEIKDFLLTEDLISVNIPQSLFDKGYIIESKRGSIEII